MTDRLAQHIEDPVSDERLERIWQKIEDRHDEYRPSSSRMRLAVAFGGLAIAAGVALGWFVGAPLHEGTESLAARATSAPLFEVGAALSTAAEKMSVALEDGSKVTLAPRSRVSMQNTDSEDVALNLAEGRITCQVAKDKGRTFSVLAGDVVVRVVGTSFSVERVELGSAEKVTVDVSEGIVEVSGPDGVTKRLGAGESWSVRLESPVPKESPGRLESEEVLAAVEAPKAALPVGSVDAHVVSSAPRQDTTRDLFTEARQKRNRGDAAGAAQLYQLFLKESPADARAGVAALELGRLRMDQLGDPAGAIGPLTRAASGVGGGLGDDALARLVQARAQLGQMAACKSVRARYLATYPKGVHVERVRAACR